MPYHDHHYDCHVYREMHFYFNFSLLDLLIMHASLPHTPGATHALSGCGTYFYRCRNTCFQNCTGGDECTGQKIMVANMSIYQSSVQPAQNVPTPATWNSLQTTPQISTLISLIIFIFIFLEEEVDVNADVDSNMVSIIAVVPEPSVATSDSSDKGISFVFHFWSYLIYSYWFTSY